MVRFWWHNHRQNGLNKDYDNEGLVDPTHWMASG